MASEASRGEFWTGARLWGGRRYIAICLLLGAVLGAATGYLMPQTFTAENRLAVGTGSASDLNIPGFPTASAAMASNYARWIDNAAVATSTSPAIKQVTSSPFPDSNVLRLEVVASSRTAAVREADRLAKGLVDEVNRVNGGNDSSSLLGRVASKSDTAAQTQLDVDRARAGLRQALEAPVPDDEVTAQRRKEFIEANRRNIRAQLVVDGLTDRYRRLVANRSTEADLTVLREKSYITKTSRNESMQRLGLLGAGVGGLVALLLIRRRSSRVSDPASSAS